MRRPNETGHTLLRYKINKLFQKPLIKYFFKRQFAMSANNLSYLTGNGRLNTCLNDIMVSVRAMPRGWMTS